MPQMTAGPPDPATEAARALRLAERARRGGRLLVILKPFSRPLVPWGLAWMLEASALRLLPLPVSLFVAWACGAAALVTTLLVRSRDVRSPWAQAAARSWWALLLGTTVLIWVLRLLSTPFPGLLLALGVVWSLGILLYGIAAQNRSLMALGGTLVLLPVPLATLLGGLNAVFGYGLLGGAAMLAVGVWMTARRP